MDIIKVKQLPIIEENLLRIKEDVLKRAKEATELMCAEDTVKSVKSARSSLNAEFKVWEDKRKEVKNAVMSPYEKFNAIYEDCITSTYKAADIELKEKINAVENVLKDERKKEIQEHFNEYLQSKNIDFVTFESANINITLTVSTKKLKEQSKEFIDKVYDDLCLIDTQENKTEILVEYKKTLNVSNAITSVAARLKAVEDEKVKQELRRQKKFEAQKIESGFAKFVSSVQVIAPPVEVTTLPKTNETILALNFTVRGTKEKLKELKMFLENGGYDYE